MHANGQNSFPIQSMIMTFSKDFFPRNYYMRVKWKEIERKNIEKNVIILWEFYFHFLSQ